MTKLISRRRVLAGASNVVGAGTLLLGRPLHALAQTPKPITVGFIYAATRNDFGWNQAHAVAAKRIAQLPGVKLIEQERVPETVEVERVMESMIQLDGAKVVFPTSFGFWPFIQKIAPKYPEVLFVHAGGLWKDTDPKNTIGYRGYMEEPHYLCGIAAGMMSKTGKLGFIGSKPLYFIFNNCNGFVMGARIGAPRRHLPGGHHRRLGQSGQGGRDRQCAGRSGRRCDRRQRGQPQSGGRDRRATRHHELRLSYRPVGAGTQGFPHGRRVELGQGRRFRPGVADRRRLSQSLSRRVPAGHGRHQPVRQTVPQNVQDRVLKARQGFIDDTLKLYKGPLKDNKGNQVLAAGQEISNTDNPFKLSVKWLVEGAIGSTGLQ